MEKNCKYVSSKFVRKLIFLSFLFLISSGCNKKQEEKPFPNISGEKLSGFSFQQFSEKFNIELKGENAEISQDKKNNFVKKPSFSLSSKTEIIEVSTGHQGTAKVKLEQNLQKIEEIFIEGDIDIIQKNIKTNEVVMEAHCKKLTYIDKKKVLIMDGNPIIKRKKGTFSGEKIFYYWDENKVEITGKVNVTIYPDETSTD